LPALAVRRRRADIDVMARVPLLRVALAILVYPFLYVGVPAFAGRSLPAEQEGAVEVVLLACGLIVLGFVLSSWWCLIAPLLWAVVALAVGLAVPLENTDPSEGQLLVFLLLIVGVLPLGVGIAGRRFTRRLSSPL
jgi:hypothetical protein